MAEHTDLSSHTATYAGLIRLMFWGAIGCAIIAALVIWLIA